MINKSLLANSPMPSWNRTIMTMAKKKIARLVLLEAAVHKKVNCAMKKKEAMKA